MEAVFYAPVFISPNYKDYIKVNVTTSASKNGYVNGSISNLINVWAHVDEFAPSPGAEPTSSPEPYWGSIPTSTPYNEPQFTEQELILGAAVTVTVLGAGLGLLVYLIRRK